MRIRGLVIVLAVLAGGALWIEQGHRVVIDAPVAAQAQTLAAAAACPENDTVPYDSRCLEYLKVPVETAPRPQVVAVLRQAPAGAECPDSDRVPYSQGCIAFLTGATETGMRWRATAGPIFMPGPQ